METKTIVSRYRLVAMLVALLVATVAIAIAYPVQAQEQQPIFLPLILKGGDGGGGGGGGGTPTASNAFDLTISVYNNPADRTPYEANVQYFADSVYEMSNGAHKIRQVRIYSNRQFADRADIIWIDSCWPNANPSGYGRGGRIEHCDDFQGTSFIADDTGQREGGYTLGHEWGHYFYGVMDEYRGQTSRPGDLGNPEPTDTPVQNSIMNGQWQAVNGNFSWLNFSTEVNNGPGAQNAQRRVFQASAWTTLARPPSQDPAGSGIYSTGGSRLYYADLANFAPAAGQTPSIELPAGQATARDQLQIVWMGNTPGALNQAGAVVTEPPIIRYLVLEINADTMDSNDKLINVIDAAGLLIDEALIGDTIGIITYDGTVNVVQPLTEIDSESTRNTLFDALDGIALGGSGAATGSAARQALTDITASSVPTDVNRAVYLISGGPVTTGENLALGVIPAYETAGIELYAFGYGVDEATETKLQNAEFTGGGYTFIDDSDFDEAFEELLDAFEEADQNVSPIVDINIETGGDTIIATSSITVPFVIDSTLGEVEVEVYYQGPITAATLSLVDPDDQDDPAMADCEEFGTGTDDTDTLCILALSDPISGTWSLRADNETESDVEIDYWMGGVVQDGDFTLDADIESDVGEDVDVGEEITFYATVANNEYNVTDVTIDAILFEPDDTEIVLDFRDDGTAPDGIAQDGIYTASFTPTKDGEHYVFVAFDNNDGQAKFTEFGTHYAVAPGTDQTKALADPFPVGEDFQRFAEFEFDADE